jgi:hypothetical protein
MSVRLGQIAAGASAVMLALCVGPVPALAAPAVELHLERVTLAPGGNEKLVPVWASISGSQRHGARLTLDYSAISDFATVVAAEVLYDSIGTTSRELDELNEVQTQGPSSDPGAPCVAGEGKYTCTLDGVTGRKSPWPLAFFALTPRAGATTGKTGVMSATLVLDGGVEKTVTSEVRVGQAVDLRALENDPITVAPGKAGGTDVRVRNVGSTPVEGAVLLMNVDERVRTGTTHANCWYGEYTVACTFESTLAPGTSYGLSAPVTFRPPADAIPGSVLGTSLTWMTGTEWSDLTDSFASLPSDDGEAGTGPALTLTELAAAAADPQADIDDENNWADLSLTVSGKTTVDLAAVGDRITAPVGDKATVRVGVINHGPGRLYPDLFYNNVADFIVTIPENTVVTSEGDDCFDTGNGSLWCRMRPALAPGGKEVFPIGLRVEKRKGDAGKVEVLDQSRAEAQLPDANPDNNVAKLVVTGTGGEDLPITGPAGYLAFGAFLLAVGVVGRYLGRRRA